MRKPNIKDFKPSFAFKNNGCIEQGVNDRQMEFQTVLIEREFSEDKLKHLSLESPVIFLTKDSETKQNENPLLRRYEISLLKPI